MVLEIRRRVTPVCICRSSRNFHTIFRYASALYWPGEYPLSPSSKIFWG